MTEDTAILNRRAMTTSEAHRLEAWIVARLTASRQQGSDGNLIRATPNDGLASLEPTVAAALASSTEGPAAPSLAERLEHAETATLERWV
jgi:hypothetical protein